MTADEMEAVVRGLYQSFDLKDLDRFDAVALSGADLEWRPFDARIGLREAWTAWATAFPDARIEIVRLDATGDTVAAQIIGRGRHDGPLELPIGTVRPTHRDVTLHLTETFELDESEGKIAHGTSEFDLGELFEQLGVPRPENPPREEPRQSEFHWGY